MSFIKDPHASAVRLKRMQVRMASEYDKEVFDGIYRAASDYRQSAEKYTAQRAGEIAADPSLTQDEKNEMLYYMEDDGYFEEKTEELAAELTIIALYKTIEISIKDMMRHSGLFTDAEIRNCYKTKELKRVFRKKVCAINKLNGFNEYDELRCINNEIKHSARVGRELAKFPYWKKGDKLKVPIDVYKRLEPEVSQFIKEVSDNICNKIV